MKNGKLIVIAAPSGSGKTSIVKSLISDESLNLGFSVSATSREKRENEIAKSLKDAEKARKELDRLTSKGNEIIAKARSEAQAIVGEGKKAAEQLKESTLSKAKETAAANLDDAKEQIKMEKEKAIAEIKGEVVGLSLSIAEKLVKKNLNEEDNKSLINESLKNIKGYEA